MHAAKSKAVARVAMAVVSVWWRTAKVCIPLPCFRSLLVLPSATDARRPAEALDAGHCERGKSNPCVNTPRLRIGGSISCLPQLLALEPFEVFQLVAQQGVTNRLQSILSKLQLWVLFLPNNHAKAPRPGVTASSVCRLAFAIEVT